MKDIDTVVKEHKEKLAQRDQIVFDTSLIRLAIPESKSEADKDQELLKELGPPPRPALEDIPKYVEN